MKTPTTEQFWKWHAEACQAQADGIDCEFEMWADSGWLQETGPLLNFCAAKQFHRIKPKKSMRAWYKLSEVPVRDWFRLIDEPELFHPVDKIDVTEGTINLWINLNFVGPMALRLDFEHSNDLVTWHRCEVEA
jgi:hypothetical protein